MVVMLVLLKAEKSGESWVGLTAVELDWMKVVKSEYLSVGWWERWTVVWMADSLVGEMVAKKVVRTVVMMERM